MYFSKYVPDTLEALAFADAAYNGGIAGVNLERKACYVTKGCDSNKWFGHTEKICLKSKLALYGNRSACDINRHHVRDVLLVRPNKYKGRI
jgi:membrane-bound lytic murein transglycosylase MltF